MYKKLTAIFVFLMCATNQAVQERFFTIIVPSFNNIEWYQKNLDSIFSQNYTNYKVIYIDDNSTDGTTQAVYNYLVQRNLLGKCEFVHNEKNYGALYNLYRAIHSCPDDCVVVTVDGDDWLAHENVLSYLNQLYADENVWISYGQYQTSKGGMSCCRPYEQYIIDNHTYRESMWRASHLRVFYAGLFKKIKLSDFLYDGNFLKVAWDLSFMYPMIEMAAGNYKCVEDVLYIYNVENPISDHRIDLSKQLYHHFVLTNKDKYKPLKSKNEFLKTEKQDFAAVLFIENDNEVDNNAKMIATITHNPLCKQVLVFTTVGYPRDQLQKRVGPKVTIADCAYFTNDLFNNENEKCMKKYLELVQTITATYVVCARNLKYEFDKIPLSQMMQDLKRTGAFLGFIPGDSAHNSENDSIDVGLYHASHAAYPYSIKEVVLCKNVLKEPVVTVSYKKFFKKYSSYARIIGGFNSILAAFEKDDSNELCLWYQQK